MKRFTLLIAAISICFSSFAQPSPGFVHQAVVRDAQGHVVAGEPIGIRASIIKGSEQGEAVFVEDHAAVSNANGLVSFVVGQGTLVSGNFAGIDWSDGPYFIKIVTDPSGGVNYSLTSITELTAVPYALLATTAESYGETDPVFSESLAAEIATGDIANWHEAYNRGNHAEAGYLLGETQNLADVLAQGNDGGGFQVKNIAEPTAPGDLATKAYVDRLHDRLLAIELKTGSAVLDVDGNIYRTITIGNQVWLNKNLRVSRYNNREPITSGLGNADWEQSTSGAFSIYDHTNFDAAGIDSDDEMLDAYGALYNWHAVNDPRGLCPEGWHVPGFYEILRLRDHLIDNHDDITLGNLANVLKSCRQVESPLGGECETGWHDHPRWNPHGTHYGTDNFGFSALPAGRLSQQGASQNLGHIANWWTSSLWQDQPYSFQMMHSAGTINHSTSLCTNAGLSVRCIKSKQDCDDDVTFMYRGEQVTYGVVYKVGLCWMDRNLGASQVPVSSDDPAGYGDLFQWGRPDDGHQDRQSGTTTTLSDTDVPGHDDFIKSTMIPNDWRSPQNNDLWQGDEGINNPCPPGWRLPTQTELDHERLSWTSNNAAGAFASSLRWPAAGIRQTNDAFIQYEGTGGGVWSATVDDSTTGYYRTYKIIFLFNSAGIGGYARGLGNSVRCVKEPQPK